ncbi:MAG: hypothetical protein ACOYLK_17350 [Sphingomonas sp.]
MRISGLAVLSTAHMPAAERDTIEVLIAAAPVIDGRQTIAFHGIEVETHSFGFFLNTGLVVEDERPSEVSATLWHILNEAERQGCDWVLFDRDEPTSPALPLFD